MTPFVIAQLRHAWQHLDQGRPEAGKQVLASVIRLLESKQNEDTQKELK